MFDENEPRTKRKFEIGQKLDELSLSDIDGAIGDLRTEIARLEEARERKSAHLGAAEALFKKP